MWEKIRAWFKDSETIFLARLQALFGVVVGTMSAVDPVLLEPLLTPRGFSIYVIVSGLLTEVARRMREKDM